MVGIVLYAIIKMTCKNPYCNKTVNNKRNRLGYCISCTYMRKLGIGIYNQKKRLKINNCAICKKICYGTACKNCYKKVDKTIKKYRGKKIV